MAVGDYLAGDVPCDNLFWSSCNSLTATSNSAIASSAVYQKKSRVFAQGLTPNLRRRASGLRKINCLVLRDPRSNIYVREEDQYGRSKRLCSDKSRIVGIVVYDTFTGFGDSKRRKGTAPSPTVIP